MAPMRDRSRTFLSLTRIFLAAAVLLALAACGDVGPPATEAPELTTQASGSFSGGSLRRGSVEATMTGAGIGNQDHALRMTVDGEQWYECANRGGNLAPGQLAIRGAVTEEDLGAEDVDGTGRFTKQLVETGPAPGDDACKRNWFVHETETFLRVTSVRVELYERDEFGDLAAQPSDSYAWTCDDPEPTTPLSEYVAPDLTGPDGVCGPPSSDKRGGGNAEGSTR